MSVSSVGAYSSYSAYLNAKNGTTAAATETATASKTAATTTTTTATADTAVSSALKQIDSKLQMGSKLTSKELSYLEDNSTDAYKEATKLQSERDSYRKQLDGAKTKMDAETIRGDKMQALSDELKSVKNSTSLTSDEKTTQMAAIQKRQMAMVNETQDYTGTAKYHNLSLTTKSAFQSMLDSTDASSADSLSKLMSYFGSSKSDASSFLSILNSTKQTSNLFGNGYYSTQLNAAQQLVNASYQAQNIQRESVITQVLARESAKAAAATKTTTSTAAVAQNTETAAKLNLTV